MRFLVSYFDFPIPSTTAKLNLKALKNFHLEAFEYHHTHAHAADGMIIPTDNPLTETQHQSIAFIQTLVSISLNIVHQNLSMKPLSNNMTILVPRDPATGVVNELNYDHLTNPKHLNAWFTTSNYTHQVGIFETRDGVTRLDMKAFTKWFEKKV